MPAFHIVLHLEPVIIVKTINQTSSRPPQCHRIPAAIVSGVICFAVLAFLVPLNMAGCGGSNVDFGGVTNVITGHGPLPQPVRWPAAAALECLWIQA